MPVERILTRSDLIAAGLSSRGITGAVRDGTLLRMRRDRYLDPSASQDARVAAALGGRLACVTALHHLGVWAASTDTTHIEVPSNSSRHRRVAGVRMHWRAPGEPAGATSLCTSVFDALAHCAECLDVDMAVASLDSALHLGLLPRHRLEQLRRALPRRSRRIVDRANGRCESGIESLLRLALEDARVPFEVQASIPGVGRVDFLVAGSVIVETDGHRWHSGDEQRARDYARDLAAARAGYVVIRLDYWQVMLERAACVEAITTVCTIVGAHVRTNRSPARQEGLRRRAGARRA